MIRTYASFSDLSSHAVAAFVKTVILIDNEPSAGIEKSSESPLPPKRARSTSFKAGVNKQADKPSDLPPAESAEVVSAGPATHQLRVQPVTNAFAGKKITCGFYFPANDESGLVDTAFAAALHVDVAIIDWQLRPNDTTPAKELIGRLLLDDIKAGGRLRLIVVYTGERNLDNQCTQLATYLRGVGVEGLETKDEGRAISRRDALICFANKPASARPELEISGPGARPIQWDKLPEFVLDQYASLAGGLLQAFALRGIGAVRDDTHHLLSVFSADLDGAYLAQRAGIGTPADAEEMMLHLLASEFSSSIRDKEIEKEVLGASGSSHKLGSGRNPPHKIPVEPLKNESIYKKIISDDGAGVKFISAGQDALKTFNDSGLDSSLLKIKGANLKKLKQQFFPNDADANAALSKFARLVSFSRESDGERRPFKNPLHLTGGVIVRNVTTASGNQPASETYLLCVQPGCDAVRLSGTVTFPFCTMKTNNQEFDVVVRVAGVDRFFLVNKRPKGMRLISFKPDAKRKVVTSELNNDKMGFWDSEKGSFWEFVAELRALEAQHFTSQLVGQFNRVALNGSEWLRLSSTRD